MREMRGLESESVKLLNYIEEKLNVLSYRITKRGKLNILDLNIHSETFFADFLNMLCDLKLQNTKKSRTKKINRYINSAHLMQI
jgi:hypothetical protein